MNILTAARIAGSKNLDDLSKDYQNLVEPVYQQIWLTEVIRTLGAFGFLSIILGVGLIIFFGLLYFYRDSSDRLQNAGTITSIYFMLLAGFFMAFGMVGSQANRSNYNTEVANYQSSVESIKSEYEAKFVEEKIMSKYDFDSQLKDIESDFALNGQPHVSLISAIYEDKSGKPYKLNFSVSNEGKGEPELNLSRDVDSDFKDSVTK